MVVELESFGDQVAIMVIIYTGTLGVHQSILQLLGFNQIHEELEITSHNIGLCMDRACIVATDLIHSDSFLNPMIQFRNSWLDYLSFCYQQNGSNIPISKGGTCLVATYFGQNHAMKSRFCQVLPTKS